MVNFTGPLQSIHLRKHWGRFVKTWFNQPANKRRRLEARKEKAAAAYPRPVSKLRPVVRCLTNKYNKRVRVGKGFTLAEIKKAGLGAAFARSIGIAVDHRRQNKSTEAFQANVQRLLTYKEKLVLFPRKDNKPKKGLVNDATAETIKQLAVQQNTNRTVLPVQQEGKREKPVKLTEELKKTQAYRTLKQEWSNQRNAGKREKRAKDTEEK